GLSPFILANSIQVNGFKGITIVSVNRSIDYLAEKEDKTFDKLLKERDDLIFEREKVRIRLRNLYKEKNFILSNKSVKSKSKGIGVEDIMDMSDFYKERLPDINRRSTEYSLQEQ